MRKVLLVLKSYEDGYPHEIVQLWRINSATLMAEFPQSLEFVGIATFFADGNLILTTSYTDAPYGGMFNEALIWDANIGQQLRNYPSTSVIFSPNGELMALYGGDITIWSNRELATLSHPSEAWQPYLMQFSPDSQTIATPLSRAILLWNVSSDQIPQEPYLRIDTESPITSLMYSPDGRYLASIPYNGIAEIWNTETGLREASLDLSNRVFSVQGMRFS